MICMPDRDKLSNLISVSITQSPTNKSYFPYIPTRPDFLNFLCERWCDEDHIGFGFKDETKSVLITAGIVTDVAALESHSKRQTRESDYIPYIVFRRKMSNELSFTQMTQTLSLYHVCTTLLRDLSGLSMLVRTARGSYLPIHGIAAAVGPQPVTHCRSSIV